MGTISIQDILYYGYIYLLLLGIASESIYYGILDVEVLDFTDILNLLLTPVEHLTQSFVFTLIILGFPALLYPLIRRSHKRSPFHRFSARQWWVGISMLVIFIAYMGLAIGGAKAVREDMRNGTITPNHYLTFEGQDPLPVKLIDIKGDFVFYIERGKQVVSVSPISVSMTRIEKMPVGAR